MPKPYLPAYIPDNDINKADDNLAEAENLPWEYFQDPIPAYSKTNHPED